MCGIAGIVKFDPGARVPAERMERMRDALAHRGPDAACSWLDGPVGLGHRRLAIVDIGGGGQPMTGPGGTTRIVFNGEIYNHPQLSTELRARGRAYRTRSDTETILQLYDELGERCVEKLRGMFAFALWDGARRRLLLARDRLGIKPLYYAVGRDELVFASEIKAILAAGTIAPEFDVSVVPEFLATRFVAGDGTFFRGIKKLLPGRTLSWTPGHALSVRRYWRPPAPSLTPDAPPVEPGELRERIVEATRLHLMSDVPIGVFLSGGLDSAALAGLVAPMLTEPLRTFSVGFDEPEANELAWARLAARSARTIHHEVVVSRSSFVRALPRLIWHEDEPIAFSSSVPLYFLAKAAARHVKVVLTGEGADEIFLGYNRYRITAWNERLGRVWRQYVPAAGRARAARIVASVPGTLGHRMRRTFLARGDAPRDMAFDNFAVFPEHVQRRLLRDPRLLREHDPYAATMRSWNGGAGGAADAMSRADIETYLVELLMKQDQMSMAASIESRVPYLDHELVEYVVGLPANVRLQGTRTKAILRDAVKHVVPRAILDRRKMGFPVPVARWLRGSLRPAVQELVLGARATARGLFDPEALQGLVSEHEAGTTDHGERLWLLLNLEIWQRVFLDREDPQAIAETLHA